MNSLNINIVQPVSTTLSRLNYLRMLQICHLEHIHYICLCIEPKNIILFKNVPRVMVCILAFMNILHEIDLWQLKTFTV